jgi:hypothetical protein
VTASTRCYSCDELSGRNSPSKAVDLLLVGLCMSLGAAPAAGLPETPETEAEQGTASDQKSPVPVRPPNEPVARGYQVALLVGIDIFGWGGYSYDTRVNLPDGQLRYRGADGAPGLAFSGGGAVTLPGAWRRLTVGASFSAGGLHSSTRPVIPAGVSTPFSQTNLQNNIRYKYSLAPGWTSGLSLYIEHELGFLHESRVRAGYQYRRQTGLYKGTFEPTGSSRALAEYDVRLESRSHLIRISVNDYNSLLVPDSNSTTPRRHRRRAGLIRQWGVMIGTHRTIIVFAGMGPFWETAR